MKKNHPTWYYSLPDGTAAGPISAQQLQRLINRGEVDLADQVTPAQEPPDWRPAADHQFRVHRLADTERLVSGDSEPPDPMEGRPDSVVGAFLFLIGWIVLGVAGMLAIVALGGDHGWVLAPFIGGLIIGGLLLIAVGRMVQYLAEICHYARHLAVMAADRHRPDGE